MRKLVLSGFLASEEIYINQLEALLLVSTAPRLDTPSRDVPQQGWVGGWGHFFLDSLPQADLAWVLPGREQSCRSHAGDSLALARPPPSRLLPLPVCLAGRYL